MPQSPAAPPSVLPRDTALTKQPTRNARDAAAATMDAATAAIAATASVTAVAVMVVAVAGVMSGRAIMAGAVVDLRWRIRPLKDAY